jgi:hypothetical protein
MSGSLLHFQRGVPIDDLNLRRENRDRLARVEHVYWQWIRNPFTVDYKALLRQLVRGHYADAPSECHAAQKDVALFEFIKENVTLMSRKEAQLKVQVAAEQAIKIGMETDNVNALTKGGKLLYEVAGLDKPEDNSQDMSKVMFLPPVVTTNVTDVDPSRENITDEQALAIIKKYNAYVDTKRQAVDERVEQMLARREAGINEGHTETTEITESDE